MTTAAIPDEAWRAPMLRGLDPLARSIIGAASRVRSVATGVALFGENDEGDALYLVLDGALELLCVRRGEDTARTLRTAGRGDTLGEEAILGRRRAATARALEPARVLEIPANLLRRGSGRSGAELADRELRALVRQATADLLRSHALGRMLPDHELDLVLDAVRPASFARSDRVYAAGDGAREVYLLVDGLVQLQREDDTGIHVQAYLSRGDLFGDDEALAGTVRRQHAVAIGPAEVLRLPADVLRTLADRNPGLLGEVRRVAEVRADVQQAIVGEAAAQTTRHVFHDLYRMQMARSLLVIDQDLCVRCGHCAWSCAALHGTSRLVRRGDKVITRLPVLGEGPRSLLLPNSCQHCKNPACMIDCPTGAIGRDPDGEVWIRAELCTGCGNCAKACPWDNIRMAARPVAAAGSLRAVAPAPAPASIATPSRRSPLSHVYPEIAVKCDLCREYDAPACVSTCPTGAILRLDPTRDVAEVAEVLGLGNTTKKRVRVPVTAIVVGLALALALGLGATAWQYQALGRWTPGQGIGLNCGIAAAIAIVLLVLYAIPKRVVRLWAHPKTRTRADKVGLASTKPAPAAPRSRVRPLYAMHLVLGLGAMAAVIGHAGARIPDDPAGALHVAFWVVALGGAALGLAYRVVPRRLSRIEREGLLPEDLRRRRTELVDRLYRAGSGKSDLVKAIADKILVPYARAPLGSVALFVTGRTLADEEARLSTAINRMLQGRGHERLQGLPELVKVVVELRALPLRRAYTFVLRGLLPVHVIATGVLLALLALHVVVELGG